MLPEAAQELNRMLLLNPVHPSLLATAGNIEHRMGNLERGLNFFLMSLDVKPQEDFLREYVEFLNPEAHPFEKDYALDPEVLIASFSREENPYPLASAVYLADNRVEKVYSSGLSSSFSQLVLKLSATSFQDNFLAQCARNCIYVLESSLFPIPQGISSTFTPQSLQSTLRIR